MSDNPHNAGDAHMVLMTDQKHAITHGPVSKTSVRSYLSWETEAPPHKPREAGLGQPGLTAMVTPHWMQVPANHRKAETAEVNRCWGMHHTKLCTPPSAPT